MDWLGGGNSTSSSGNSGQGGRLVNNSPPPSFHSKPQSWPQASGFFPRTFGWGKRFPPTSLSLFHLFPSPVFPPHFTPLPHLSPPHLLPLSCLPTPIFLLSPLLSPPPHPCLLPVCLPLPALLLPSIVPFIIYKFPSFSSAPFPFLSSHLSLHRPPFSPSSLRLSSVSWTLSSTGPSP